MYLDQAIKDYHRGSHLTDSDRTHNVTHGFDASIQVTIPMAAKWSVALVPFSHPLAVKEEDIHNIHLYQIAAAIYFLRQLVVLERNGCYRPSAALYCFPKRERYEEAVC